MKNPYKRLDIFQCKYHSHAKFDYRVSAYHVLRVKNCYPQGCLSFKWKCQLLNKGKSCIKGFRHVGQKCFGCKHYYDEKVNNHPQLLISDEDYQQFLNELEEFEDWLENIKNKTVEFWGIVNSVKPHFTKVINADNSSVNLEGYILHFTDAYLDTLHWEDHCYVRLFADQQERYKFAPEDDVECKCQVEFNQGRLIIKKIRAVEFRNKSTSKIWNNTKALVAKGTATTLVDQTAKCLLCPDGVLIDVIDKSKPKWDRRRELYCLKSVKSPEFCHYQLLELLNEVQEECP